jgi:adenosyl cobinamide kinase/adenosyl cobinamide phosphate guanylyltransferase
MRCSGCSQQKHWEYQLSEDQNNSLVLLLGGARAGKSSMALRLAKSLDTSVCFIATAQGLDEDMESRIAKHKAERPPGWLTIEEPYQIDQALQRASDARVVIVDCLTLFVSNWLMRYEDENQCAQYLLPITRSFLEQAQSQQQTIICVSNEVGLGIVPETRLGRTFRDLLGRVNQDFAQAADKVYLMCAGLSVQLKP